MRLPEMKLSQKYDTTTLLGYGVDVKQTNRQGCDRTYALGIDPAALPVAKRRGKRKYVSGVTGTPVAAFSDGAQIAGVISKSGDITNAYWGFSEYDILQHLELGAENSAAPLAQIALVDNKLYLPGYASVLDFEQNAVYPLSVSYDNGERMSGVENAEEGETNRHTFYFPVSEITGLHAGQYMRLTYSTPGLEPYHGNVVVKVLSVDSSTNTVTVLGDADYFTEAENGTITLTSLFPENVRGMFVHHGRLYCFAGTKIYASALGMYDCMGDTRLFDADKDGFVLEVGEDVTGGCVYNGEPIFFTSNASIRVEGIGTGRTFAEITPLRGVAKGMGGTLAVAGSKICYFSDAGLTVSNGKESSVVRRMVALPAANSTAASDGRLYFFSNGEESGSFFGYDVSRDLLYCLEQSNVSSLQMVDSALLGVMEDSEHHKHLTVLSGWGEIGIFRNVIESVSTFSFGEEATYPAVRLRFRVSLAGAGAKLPSQVVLDEKVGSFVFYSLYASDGRAQDESECLCGKYLSGNGVRELVDFGMPAYAASIFQMEIVLDESATNQEFVFYGITLRWRK